VVEEWYLLQIILMRILAGRKVYAIRHRADLPLLHCLLVIPMVSGAFHCCQCQ